MRYGARYRVWLYGWVAAAAWQGWISVAASDVASTDEPALIGRVTPPRTFEIRAIRKGYYDSYGQTSQGGSNYFVGNLGNEHRNFFVFSLAGVPTGVLNKVQSARLTIFQPPINVLPPPSMLLPNKTEGYQLFDVTTAVATLLDYGGGVDTWQDLGTGTVYGSREYSAADSGTFTSIDLNAAALADINASRGSTFAIGGAINPLRSGDRGIFGFSGGSTVSLTLVIPEPAALSFLAAALTAGSLRPRRCRSKATEPLAYDRSACSASSFIRPGSASHARAR